MRNVLILSFVACIVFFSCGKTKPKEVYINNPVPVKFGDPYILKASDGIYYMVGTGGVKDGFKMYSSVDLKEWKDEGQIYQGNTDSSWCVGNFWAPELYEFNDKYYLFFSADWRENPTNELENFRIGVAVSDNPTGPYTDLFNRPIFDPGYPIIDANLLVDNGKIYLYYSRCCYKHPVESEIADWAREQNLFNEIEESWIYGVELTPDFSGIVGEPKLLLRPPVKLNDTQAEWESRSVTSGEINRRWTEGSYIFKENNVYYMMYSANYFGGENYAVGYAISNQPLGLFIKSPDNPVLQRNDFDGGIVTGTGHNSITIAPDGQTKLCVYHGRTSETGSERVVFIDSMKIEKNKKLIVFGPSTSVND